MPKKTAPRQPVTHEAVLRYPAHLASRDEVLRCRAGAVILSAALRHPIVAGQPFVAAFEASPICDDAIWEHLMPQAHEVPEGLTPKQVETWFAVRMAALWAARLIVVSIVISDTRCEEGLDADVEKLIDESLIAFTTADCLVRSIPSLNRAVQKLWRDSGADDVPTPFAPAPPCDVQPSPSPWRAAARGSVDPKTLN